MVAKRSAAGAHPRFPRKILTSLRRIPESDAEEPARVVDVRDLDVGARGPGVVYIYTACRPLSWFLPSRRRPPIH